MKARLPLGATLLTLVMVPVLIALGIWQLQRREWKANLIAQSTAAPGLPPVTAAEFATARAGKLSLQYRRAVLDCRPGRVKPYDLKGGVNAVGDPGFLVLVDCRDPVAPDVVAVAGWTQRTHTLTTLDVVTRFDGLLIEHPYDDAPGKPRWMLIPTTAVAPLAVSKRPEPGDLPDNHLSYALQWFAFAATLAVVYGVYVARWRRERAVATSPSPR